MSQLKEHTNRTFIHKWRSYKQSRRLGHCGENVFFDKGVDIFRFPQHVKIADGAMIKAGARICACNKDARVTIGKNTTFGYHSHLFASSTIEIGDNCLIAPFVYIVDTDHGIKRDQLINTQPNVSKPIKIGNDVWIGTGAKILSGVTIGEGAVIAAGALVKDDVEPYKIVGGIPAKVISERV
jgi:acetyltransferase-like isoleucine patch superfamily enzyme